MWPLLFTLLACPGAPAPDPDDSTPLPDPACAVGAQWDGTACVPEACGLPPFGDVDADLFVDASAPPGGDGSREHPLDTLDAALLAAPAGHIALAAGTYVGAWRLGNDAAGLDLSGRCADLVSVDAAGADVGFDLDLRRNGRITLAGLSLGNTGEAAIRVQGGELVLVGVAVHDPGELGIHLTGDTTTGDFSGVTVSGADAGTGLRVEDGADLVFDGLTLLHTRAWALDVETSATVSGTGLVVDTVAEVANYGMGIYVVSNATVDLGEASVANTVGLASFVAGAGSSLTLRDSRVGPVLDSRAGAMALWAQQSGRITTEGSTLEDLGIWGAVADEGGFLDLHDTLVTRVRASGDNKDAGVVVLPGGTLSFEQLTLDTVSYAGVVSQGGVVTGTGLSIAHVGRFAGTSGGVLALDGGLVQITDVHLDDSWVVGVMTAGAGTRVDVTDLSAESVDGEILLDGYGGGTGTCTRCTVSHAGSLVGVTDAGTRWTVTDASGEDFRVAAYATGGAAITLDGAVISGFTDAGAYADGVGTEVDARDLTLWGDVGVPSAALAAQDGGVLRVERGEVHTTGLLGAALQYGGAEMYLDDVRFGAPGERMTAGIQAIDASRLVAEGVSVEGASDFGMVAGGAGVTAEVVDLVVRDVRRSPLAAMGVGIIVEEEAVAELSDVEVDGTEGPGLIVVLGAEARCVRCGIAGSGFAGAVLLDASLVLVDPRIEAPITDAQLGGGVGIHGTDRDGTTHLEVTGGSVAAGPYAGAWLVGDGAWRWTDVTLGGGPGVPLGAEVVVHGNAIFGQGTRAWDGTRGLEVQGGSLGDARVGVLLDDASASFSGVSWTGNTLDLQQQRCDGDPGPLPAETAATTRICPPHDDLVVNLPWSYNLPEVVVKSE